MRAESAPSELPFAFHREALDRADFLRDRVDALRGYWHNAQVLLIDDDGRSRARADGGPLALRGGDLAAGHEAAVFLGLREDEAWFALAASAAFAAEIAPDAAAPASAAEFATAASAATLAARAAWSTAPAIDLRSAAAQWPIADATAFAQARALLYWQARHRHCGVCGGKLAFVRGGWLGRCGQCGLEHYPRTDPAVIVAVTDGSRLLLGRQVSWPPRRYSTLAGFVEPGETLEQTVAREVMEESGVRVRGCRYLASQPWPFPSSLMLGFIADAHSDHPQANEELEDARWFDRDEIGAALRGETREHGLLLSPSISISRWLIETWYASAQT